MAADIVAKQDVVPVMGTILAGMAGCLTLLSAAMTPKTAGDGKRTSGRWMASQMDNPAKLGWEMFNLLYSIVWIMVFAAIVIFQLYETWNEAWYLGVLVGLCLPIFLFPIFYPSDADAQLPLTQRFGFRANIWIAIYSFIGNYWYTHYFYCVLKAKYTFPSWRLNDVPIPLYFATFFYFCFYHTLSNMAIRKVVTSFEPGKARTVFLCAQVFVMSYFTAFMETLTISSFPYYEFEDRDMAYTIGSAFYGIYFLVSFPMFYQYDEHPKVQRSPSVWRTIVDSLGCGMLILLCLDFVRLLVGLPLTIQG